MSVSVRPGQSCAPHTSCMAVCPSVYHGKCISDSPVTVAACQQVVSMEDVRVVSVACGWRHSIVADAEGVVYTFGWCKYGQLGHGNTW